MRIRKVRLLAICLAIVTSFAMMPVFGVNAAEGIHPTEGNVIRFDNVDAAHTAEVNQHVDIGVNLNELGITSVGTFEAWVKSEDVSQNRDIISDWGNNVGLTVRVTRNIEAYVYPGDYRIRYTEPQKIDVDEWHHVALVLNEDVMIGYVDGEYVTEVPLDGPVGPSEFTLKIGMRGDGGNKFLGCITDVRIWNVARTEQQIKDNKDKKLTGKESGLVGYWKLDEASGNIAYDSAGNHNGTINGNPERILGKQDPSQTENPTTKPTDDVQTPVKTADSSLIYVVLLLVLSMASIVSLMGLKVKKSVK